MIYIFGLDEVRSKMKNYEKTRAANLVRYIWKKFNEGKKSRKLLLNNFSDIKGSRMTQYKARKALRVESKSIAGKYYWIYPKRTLEEALQILAGDKKNSLYKAAQEKDQTEKYVIYLEVALEEYSYDAPVNDIKQNVKAQGGYSSAFLFKAKKKMGLMRYWTEQCWHWYWPDAPAISDWVDEQISTPITLTDLMQRAKKFKFTEQVIARAITLRPGVILNAATCQKLGIAIPAGFKNKDFRWNPYSSYDQKSEPGPIGDVENLGTYTDEELLPPGDYIAPGAKKKRRPSPRIKELEERIAQLERRIENEEAPVSQ